MSDQLKLCPKCQSRMTDGFILDLGHSPWATGSQWREGPPVRSFWFGIWSDRRRKHEIHAYCCDRCGFIEHYVLDRTSAPAGEL